MGATTQMNEHGDLELVPQMFKANSNAVKRHVLLDGAAYQKEEEAYIKALSKEKEDSEIVPHFERPFSLIYLP